MHSFSRQPLSDSVGLHTKFLKHGSPAGVMAKLSYGPNVLISLALLLLGVGAWLVLVSFCTSFIFRDRLRRLAYHFYTRACRLVITATLTGGFLQLAGASALQKNGSVIAPLLTMNAATLATGDLTPVTEARRIISYEWFKYVLFVCCSLLFVDAQKLCVQSNLSSVLNCHPVLVKLLEYC